MSNGIQSTSGIVSSREVNLQRKSCATENEEVEVESGCHLKETMTMKTSRVTTGPMALRQAESSRAIEEFCRKLRVSHVDVRS